MNTNTILSWKERKRRNHFRLVVLFRIAFPPSVARVIGFRKKGRKREGIRTHLTRRHEEQVQLLKRERMYIRTESVTVGG